MNKGPRNVCVIRPPPSLGSLLRSSALNLHEQPETTNGVHMHGLMFIDRCDGCDRPTSEDRNLDEPLSEIP